MEFMGIAHCMPIMQGDAVATLQESVGIKSCHTLFKEEQVVLLTVVIPCKGVMQTLSKGVKTTRLSFTRQ